jgi:hypothetical protein
MTFPVGPTNGEKANVNGVTYTYNSTLTAWTVSSNFLDGISANLVAANNITSSNTVVVGTTVSATGNITGGNVITSGLISAAGNITGGNLIGTIRTAAQTNITSVGTLSALSVTGNITGGNVAVTNNISAGGNLTVSGSLIGDGVSFADSTPANTLVTTTSGNVGIGTNTNLTARLNFPEVNSGEVINYYSSATEAARSGVGKYTSETRHYVATNDFFAWRTGGPSGTERMRIDSAGRVTTPSQPLFSASDSRGLNITSQVLTSSNCFDSIDYNVGGHFNAGTGRFTAPVAGYYDCTFHCADASASGKDTNLRIRKNGLSNSGPLTEAYNQAGLGGTNVFVRCIIQCSIGDYIDFEAARLNTVGAIQHKRFIIHLIG